MKIILFTLLLLSGLVARENPFEAPFERPKSIDNAIPILDIKNHKVYKTPTKIITKPKIIKTPTITPIKKIETPKIKKIVKIPEVKKEFLLEPIIINDIAPTEVITVEKIKPRKKTKKKYRSKKKYSYKTIYKNYFLKVVTNYKNIKIYTKDKLLEKRLYKNPKRVAFDFKKLQYFHTKNVALNKWFAKKIKIGSHHDFYRITIVKNKKSNFKIKKTNYGYLIY